MSPLLSPWIPVLVLGALVAVARVRQNSWIAPSVFAPALWLLYILLPLLLAPEYHVSNLSLWLLLLLIACISGGAMISENGPRNEPEESGRKLIDSVPGLLGWVVLLSALSFVGAIYAAVKAVSDYGLTPSLVGVLAVGRLLTLARYAGEQTPMLVRILVVWMYPAAVLAGISYGLTRNRRQRILCFSPLLPAVAFSLVEAAKANTLMVAVLSIGAYLGTRVSLGKDNFRLARKRTLVFAAVAIIAALSLFQVVDLFRGFTGGEISQVDTSVDWGRVKTATIGYLGVFSDWVDRPGGMSVKELNLGVYTLGGLFEALGLHARRVGVYGDFVNLDDRHDSNVYTAFRGVIEDFSFPGALLVCVLLGLASGRAYRIAAPRSISAAFILTSFYAFMLWSPLGSVFVYNGPILALAVSAILLRHVTRASAVRHQSPGVFGFQTQ